MSKYEEALDKLRMSNNHQVEVLNADLQTANRDKEALQDAMDRQRTQHQIELEDLRADLNVDE